MTKLNLDNQKDFEFPNEKRILFYGSNGIGKTQISKALKNALIEKNLSVLLFDSEILGSEMIARDNNGENGIKISPFIRQIEHLELEIDKLKNKLAVKPLLKTKYGTFAQKDFGFSISIPKYIKDDVYCGLENKTEIYSEKVIRELIKPSKSKINLPDILKAYEGGELTGINSASDVYGSVEPTIHQLRRKIVDESLNKCPVCLNDIDKDLLISELKKSSIDNDLKNSIIYYLEIKDPEVSIVISEIFGNLFSGLGAVKVLTQVEESILKQLSDAYDQSDIEKYLKFNKELEDLYEKHKSFAIKNKDLPKIVSYIKKELNNHNLYSGKTDEIEVSIDDKGLLKINGPIVSFEDMSRSEKNLFCIIYYKILVSQKTENKEIISIIIDDPFDSYDDVYVENMINVLIQIGKDFDKYIDGFYAFSHSTNIFNLYKKIKKQKFKIYWLDNFLEKNEISKFIVSESMMISLEKNPGDFGIALVNTRCSEFSPYLMIATASILRNHADISRELTSSAEPLNEINESWEKYYKYVSNTVNHPKVETTIDELAKNTQVLYRVPNCSVDLDKTVSKIIEEIDPYNFVEFIKKNGVNEFISLFTWKYILALLTRRLFESELIEILKKNSIVIPEDYLKIQDLIDLAPQDFKPIEKLVTYFNQYSAMLNSFNHASNCFLPPVMIYSSDYIQIANKDLSNLLES